MRIEWKSIGSEGNEINPGTRRIITFPILDWKMRVVFPSFGEIFGSGSD